jgi:RIO kinase 1
MSRVDELLYPTKKERFEDRRKEGHQRELLDEFFDHATLVTISRLINQGQFDSLDYPISTGKEGGVFRASGAGGYRAVKVYRIGNSIFRHLPPYVMEELLREAGAHQRARLIFAWARREHTILRRLTEAGVRCPQPYGYLRNVLVMEFVGEEGRPAAPLQEVELADPPAFFEELVQQVRRMYGRAGLVHADLSPYNLLVLSEHPVVIDVAQSVARTHPQAAALLERDVANLAKYFRRIGVDAASAAMLEAIRAPLEGPAGGS